MNLHQYSINKVRKFDKKQNSDETKQNFDLNYYTVQP